MKRRIVSATDDASSVLDAEAEAAAASSPAPAAGGEPAFKGYVDGLSHQWRVVGWARSLHADIERLHVQLQENDRVLDTALAATFRGDLLGARIGDGQYGFSLKIPAPLFDGSRHTLVVRVANEQAPGIVGTLDVSLPNRTPPKALGAAPATAQDVLNAVLPPREKPDAGLDAHAADLTRVLAEIARAYDHATALGLLYVHVLRRRIDHDGLQTRLTRLSAAPDELATVVREVLASDEAKQLYRPGSAHRFPDLSALDVWTRLRRST